tara:strand:- start:53 stop:241 length:189 start_codon:yes stop_codon:yes gene_type:complete
MNKIRLLEEIKDIEEHISHLQWRCENTINNSELKKLNKTMKSLNKTRLKLSKKLVNSRSGNE